MPVNQKPSLKLSQKLLMTPALQQAIKLLQLTRLELEQVLRQELEANPLLELAEDVELEEQEETAAAEAVGAPATTEEPATPELPAPERANGDGNEEVETAPSFEEVELSALFANDLHDVPPLGDPSFDEEELDPLFNLPNPEPSLADALIDQLRLLPVPPELSPLCEFLIGNLENDGYLRTPLPDLAAQVGVSVETLEEALRWVQMLDPAGVGARDLRECLLLQLERLSKPTEDERLAKAIVEEAFGLLLAQDWQAMAARFGVSMERLRRALEVLRKLPAHPGALVGASGSTTIEPDVVVKKVGGRWVVELVDDNLPQVHLSPRYLQLLQNPTADPQTQAFVRERMKQALWFLRAVEQRHSTILRVAETIVRRQEAFLEHGIQYLRPMVLKDVADEIGMHESTVSRVVQAKYMATPRGVFPFKFFFHSGLSHALEGDVSSVAVKEKIRELIENEDPARPLADARIARLLNRQGIRIARRTVAKYREEMGIPSSEVRKRGLWMRNSAEPSKIGSR